MESTTAVDRVSMPLLPCSPPLFCRSRIHRETRRGRLRISGPHTGARQWSKSTHLRLLTMQSRAHTLRRSLAGGRLIELFLHFRCEALLSQRRLVFLAQKWILEPIRNCGPALGHVARALVGILLAGHARLVLAVIVRPIPADQTQRLPAGPEMRMKPIAPIGRGGDHADGLVVLPINVVRLAVLPWGHAVGARPGIGVALALEADEHG